MLSEIATYHETIDALVGVTTLVSLPVAIALFFREKRLERIERENGTYLEVHAHYLEYLKLCLENPRARVWENEFEEPSVVEPNISKEDLRREHLIFTYFIAMAEQAFLIYSNATSTQRRRQWDGWEEYMVEYMKRDAFWRAWPSLGQQFDADFSDFMSRCARKAGRVA